MFKLNKKAFYIIEAQGLDLPEREMLEMKLKAKGVDCLVVGTNLEIIDIERNK